MRAQSIARVPQPAHASGPEACGASCALVGAVERDALGLERVDAARCVVACHLVEAGIDDRVHARHGDRGLGNVGRQNDSSVARHERAILLVGRQRPMERSDVEARRVARELFAGLADLPRACEKAQH
jgi:hypothetical protein